MPKAPNFGVTETLKLNKTLSIYHFFIVYIFEKLFLKSSFSITNLILKINDFDFSIQDFVQGYALQS